MSRMLRGCAQSRGTEALSVPPEVRAEGPFSSEPRLHQVGLLFVSCHLPPGVPFPSTDIFLRPVQEEGGWWEGWGWGRPGLY